MSTRNFCFFTQPPSITAFAATVTARRPLSLVSLRCCLFVSSCASLLVWSDPWIYEQSANHWTVDTWFGFVRTWNCRSALVPLTGKRLQGHTANKMSRHTPAHLCYLYLRLKPVPINQGLVIKPFDWESGWSLANKMGHVHMAVLVAMVVMVVQWQVYDHLQIWWVHCTHLHICATYLLYPQTSLLYHKTIWLKNWKVTSK